MAVYKATLCYPFLNSLDIRIVADQDDSSPAQWLKCKIDSSNKEITGYRIKILDSNNNQIFPANNEDGFISPISELTELPNLDEDVNTGYNGTYLYIPFFQNNTVDITTKESGSSTTYTRSTNRLLESFNAVYFTANYKADYIIGKNSDENSITFSGNDDVDNWIYYYDATEDIDWLYLSGWDGTINNELAIQDEIIFVQTSDSRTSGNKTSVIGGLWQVQSNGKLMRYTDYYDNEIIWSALSGKTVYLAKGKYHNQVFSQTTSTSYKWIDINGRPIDLNINEGSYKWVIEMFQGREQYQESAASLEHSCLGFNGTHALVKNSVYNLNYKNTNYYVFTYTGENLTSRNLHFTVDENDTNNSGHLRTYIYDENGLITSDIYSDPSSNAGARGTQINSNPGDMAQFKLINYDDLSTDWYDMTLTTGTILGSTNKRIQIADISNDYKIPEGTSTSPLVLQGKYVSLMNDDNNSTIGTRAYVQTYDASYGHVYPISDSITDIINATKVAFYKYSNDPDAILASDTVQLATDSNDNYGTKYINGNIIGLLTDSELGLIKIDSVQLQEGDYVLVKNQTQPKENGVYIAHASGACWTRAGSYLNWSSFIGKIIYVSGGTINKGKNFQSLATAGGSLYYEDNKSSSTGSTPLLFTEEKPILLYPNGLAATAVAAGEFTVTSGVVTLTDHLLDSYELKIKEYIFNINTHILYSITAISGNSVTVSELKTLGSSDYIYISNGQTYGANVLSYNSTTSKFVINNFALRSADILKNTVTQTYISPYIGLQNGMALKLKNNLYFDYNDNSTSQYLKVKEHNNSVWFIQHEELKEPLYSDSSINSNSPYKYDIRSYFRSSDENPFVTYESPYIKLGNMSEGYTNIWTYTSLDVSLGAANNFQEYDIYHNGDQTGTTEPTTTRSAYHVPLVSATVFTNSSATIAEGQVIDGYTLKAGDIVFQRISDSDVHFYEVRDTDAHKIEITNVGYSENNYYYIQEGTDKGGSIIKGGLIVTDENSLNSYVIPYLVGTAPLSAITNRYVTLQGFYYQYQQLSWESYRWVLVDYNGNIVQDTGKKYDKQMKVSFYGLSNEADDNQNIYYAILYVEDSVGNVLDFTVRLIVDPSSGNAAGIPFTAAFDCSTHSMKLTYQDNSLVYPSYNNYQNKTVDDAYIVENPNVAVGTLEGGESWDDSVTYDDWQTDQVLSITGISGNTDLSLDRLLSYSEIHGLTYKHYFADNTLEVNKDDKMLAISDDAATIATELIPSDNYAGNLFNVTCDGDESYQKINLQLTIPQPFINDYSMTNSLGSEYIYEKNNYTSAPTFSASSYYSYDRETNEYIKLDSQPSDWGTNYNNYYHKYLAASMYTMKAIINTSTVSQTYYFTYYDDNYTGTGDIRGYDPSQDVTRHYYYFNLPCSLTKNAYDEYSEWVENAYYQLSGNEYVLLLIKPENWDSNYNDYYHLDKFIPANSVIRIRNFTVTSSNNMTIEAFTQNDEEKDIWIKTGSEQNNQVYWANGTESTWLDTALAYNNKNPRLNCLYFTMKCSESGDTESDLKSKYTISGYLRASGQDTSGRDNLWKWAKDSYNIKCDFQAVDSYEESQENICLNFSMEGAHLWYKAGNDCQFNSRYPLGNLCLFSSQLIKYASIYSIPYWSENRGVLKYIKNDYIVNPTHGINLSTTNTNRQGETDTYPCWPSDDTNIYWIDEDDTDKKVNIKTCPGKWDDVTGEIGFTGEYSPVKLTPIHSIDEWQDYAKLKDVFIKRDSTDPIYQKMRLIIRYPGITNMYSTIRGLDTLQIGFEENDGVKYTKIYDYVAQGQPTLFTIESSIINYE